MMVRDIAAISMKPFMSKISAWPFVINAIFFMLILPQNDNCIYYTKI